MGSLGLLEWGAFAFGTIIGWYVYYINRYRTGEVGFNDITVLIGAIGGAAVTALFDSGGTQFAAYGIGLAIGFFGYFVALLVLVNMSENFNSDWFLDGRRIGPDGTNGYPDASVNRPRPAMAVPPNPPSDGFKGVNPADGLVVPVRLDLQASFSDIARPSQLFATDEAVDKKAERIKESCLNQRKVDANQKDCNKFVKAVAKEFKIDLTGDADAILKHLEDGTSGWTKLADGVAAQKASTEGKLVVAGLNKTELGDSNGHVVVVVHGPLDKAKYPVAYWGTISNVGDLRKNGGLGLGINYSFNSNVRDKVRYYSHPVT